MAEGCEPDKRVTAAVSRLLRLAPGERSRYIGLAAAQDNTLEVEIQEALRWEERMGGFLQQPIARLAPFDEGFTPGELVAGRFEILRKIGEGGMGIVYEAFDRKRQQRIAIKCAKAGFADLLNPELRGALNVRHPNVCLVNEIHTASMDGRSVDFLTMELLDGEPLAVRLASKGPFSFKEAAAIACQLCNGVAESHRSGVVHRDLKASNVMLCRQSDGSVRAVITDFGLATDRDGDTDLSGTPAYMAPELWRGAPATAASDIYALGVILHEMVTPSSWDASVPATHEVVSNLQRTYIRLTDELVSIEPARRVVAFGQAVELLQAAASASPVAVIRSRSANLLRRYFAVVSVVLCLGGGLAWWNQEAIANRLHPLPAKHFVAIVSEADHGDAAGTLAMDSLASDVENELVREEREHRNLLIISPRGLDRSGGRSAMLNRLRASYGANLALELSSSSKPGSRAIGLELVDTASGQMLRSRRIECRGDDCRHLSESVVRTASSLLDLPAGTDEPARLRPGTDSAEALAAFQAAEALRAKPNDSGLNDAIQQYQKAIETDPQYATAHAELAQAYCRLYDLHRDPTTLALAQANAERAIRLDDQRPEPHAALAYVNERRGDEKVALQQISRALAVDPANPHTLLWQADIYLNFNRWAEAEQTYKRLQAERPNYWLPYQQLGVVLSEQGKYQEAMEAFHSATVVAPWSGIGFNNVGMMLLKLGRVSEAIQNFRQCLHLNPEDDGAYLNLAEALRDEGKYSAALVQLREAIRLMPSDDQNWLGLADCYQAAAAGQKDAAAAYQQAALAVEHSLQTDPSDGPALIRLALFRAKSHLARESGESLQKAEKAGIADIDSQVMKARVLAVLGRKEEAAQIVKDCLRRGATIFELRSIRDLSSLVPTAGYNHDLSRR